MRNLFVDDYGICFFEVIAAGVAESEETTDTAGPGRSSAYPGKQVAWFNEHGDQETGVVSRIELLADVIAVETLLTASQK